jgi:hypothetical protein
MPVRSKSVPLIVESVEQVIGSLPVTVKVIVAEPLVALVAARVTVGAVVSITIALEPAMLFVPVGSVTEFITLPDASVGADVSTYEVTVKSALVLPAPTV